MKILWTILLAATLVSGFAWGAPTKRQLGEARARVAQANQDYKLARFAAALDGYQRAYEIAPSPRLLFNIGQCHRKLGQHERAVFFFDGYLRESPRAKNRAVVESLRAESQGTLDEERRRAEAARTPPVVTVVRTDPAPPLHPLVTRVEQRSRPITKRWYFWTALGVGALAATATIYFVANDGPDLPSGTAGTLDRR